MTITYKVFTCDNSYTVQWGDNFKSFEEAEDHIKKNKWIGNPPFIIAERMPERVFPETSLTESELEKIFSNEDIPHEVAFTALANAVIKQYILDEENKSEE